MTKPTLHLIAARLGCAQEDILQTITDLVAALDEEHTLRLEAQAAREATLKENAVITKLCELANAESALHRAEARQTAVLLKQARQEARQASVPGRVNTKTRRRT